MAKNRTTFWKFVRLAAAFIAVFVVACMLMGFHFSRKKQEIGIRIGFAVEDITDIGAVNVEVVFNEKGWIYLRFIVSDKADSDEVPLWVTMENNMPFEWHIFGDVSYCYGEKGSDRAIMSDIKSQEDTNFACFRVAARKNGGYSERISINYCDEINEAQDRITIPSFLIYSIEAKFDTQLANIQMERLKSLDVSKLTEEQKHLVRQLIEESLFSSFTVDGKNLLPANCTIHAVFDPIEPRFLLQHDSVRIVPQNVQKDATTLMWDTKGSFLPLLTFQKGYRATILKLISEALFVISGILFVELLYAGILAFRGRKRRYRPR